VVVEAEVKEAQGRPLFGVNAEVRSKEVKKSLTGPTLLEMSGIVLFRPLLSEILPTLSEAGRFVPLWSISVRF